MLTTVPAKVWGMRKLGAIKEGYRADIVISESECTLDSLFDINPENILLVLKNGEIKLIDEKISDQLNWEKGGGNDYSRVSVNGRKKYVHGNLPGLVAEVRKYDEYAPFPIEPI